MVSSGHRPITDSRLFSPTGPQAALETLLLRKPVRLKCHPLASYHYAGRSPAAPHPLLPASGLFACLVVAFLMVDSVVQSSSALLISRLPEVADGAAVCVGHC